MQQHYLSDLGMLGLGTRLRSLSDQLFFRVRDFYDQHQLPFEPRWFPVVQYLHGHPGSAVGQIAGALGVTHVSISTLVKDLGKKGLVVGAADDKDKRINHLSLTATGYELFARMSPAWLLLEQSFAELLPSYQQQNVLQSITKLEQQLLSEPLTDISSRLQEKDISIEASIVQYDIDNPFHQLSFAALNKEWLMEYFSIEPQDKKIFADPNEYILQPGGIIAFVKYKDVLIATGALMIREDVGEIPILEFTRMAVSLPFRDRGVGKKLTKWLLQQAKFMRHNNKRFDKVYAVSSTTLPVAVPMYQKLGFAPSDLPLSEHYKRANITLEYKL